MTPNTSDYPAAPSPAQETAESLDWLAAQPDPRLRQYAAQHSGTSPKTLGILAHDTDENVKECALNNPNTPESALPKTPSLNEAWDFLLKNNYCSEETLRVVVMLNGYSLGTFERILYAVSGYHSFDQLDY